ncbi:MAG: hypothetical protein HC827_03595 [Cyanobacteria bacterium RM1_2_2]|nr:hypothetical protein [Cyanobacteria bacterium RM1_2_2]
MFVPPSTRRIFPYLTVMMVALPIGSFQPAHAARIQWCMRVVPSGELVTRYGAGCRFQKVIGLDHVEHELPQRSAESRLPTRLGR